MTKRSQVVVEDHGVLCEGEGNGGHDEGVGDPVLLDVLKERGEVELGHNDRLCALW